MKTRKWNVILVALTLLFFGIGLILLIVAKIQFDALVKNDNYIVVSNYPISINNFFDNQWYQNHDFLNNHNDFLMFFFMNLDKVYPFYVYRIIESPREVLKLSSAVISNLAFFGLFCIEVIVPVLVVAFFVVFILDIKYINKHNFWSKVVKRVDTTLTDKYSAARRALQNRDSDRRRVLREIRIKTALGKDIAVAKKMAISNEELLKELKKPKPNE